MTQILFGIAVTTGMWWVAVLVTAINIFVLSGILISFIWYKMEKQTIFDFYETVVSMASIVGCELLLIALPVIRP